VNRLVSEYRVFASCPLEMRVLLITNTLYALALPVIEIFVAAYVMRNSHQASKVVLYQLAIYTAIPLAFLLNGYLLRILTSSQLYAIGMVSSGAALLLLMTSDVRTLRSIMLSGALLGLATGLSWANRGYLVLSTTNDNNRNYYYGLEACIITATSVIVPFAVGWLIEAARTHTSLGNNAEYGYRIVAFVALMLTVAAAGTMQMGKFQSPVNENFLFFHFHPLWQRMLSLAMLKGLAQGYIVTIPALLIFRLVGQEGALGIVEAAGSFLVSILLYGIGRACKPRHRIPVFTTGLILMLVGSIWNAALFNATGVIIFLGCILLAKPLLDFAYYPIQFLVTDTISMIEGRSQYAYIVTHEFGIFAGRFLGCSLFLLIAFCVSDKAALEYALPVVAVLQLSSIKIARRLVTDAARVDATHHPSGA